LQTIDPQNENKTSPTQPRNAEQHSKTKFELQLFPYQQERMQWHFRKKGPGHRAEKCSTFRLVLIEIIKA
jgi:hypothetical protein